jgi:predicted MFS family arabinose efflux permease
LIVSFCGDRLLTTRRFYTQATDPDRRQLFRYRLAISTVFLVNGATMASWVPHIPYVQTKLGLSEAMLGLALLSMAVGALISLLLSGWLIGRFGSRRVTSVAAVAFCLALPWPILAPTLPALMLALALFGLCNGAMDVAMNAQSVTLEERYRRPIMSSFHGLFSLGGLAGAAAGGLLLANGVTPLSHVLSATLILGLVGLVALTQLIPSEASPRHGDPALALPRGPVAGLCLLAFFTLVGEGAMADWSAVYLKNSLGAGPGLAAAGFAAFSLAMAVGRLTGDGLVSFFGPVKLVRASAALAALGLALAVLIGHPYAAIAGFGCVGLGLANVIPILFSAAGRTPGISAGAGIAAVATSGYFGFLAGPPLIGFVAELTHLSWSLGLVALFIGLVALFAHIARRKEQPPVESLTHLPAQTEP